MSQENVKLAQRVMQALGRRDADELVRLADSEVEWHSFFALTEGGYRGHAGTRQYMTDLGDAFDLGVAEIDDGLGIGNVVVLVGRIRYRGKGSGVESATPTGWILKFRNGKITYFRAFRDPEARSQRRGCGGRRCRRENVDLVLESIRRFGPGGLDEWAELWHQDTRMTIAEGFPEPGPFIGLDAVKREIDCSWRRSRWRSPRSPSQRRRQTEANAETDERRAADRAATNSGAERGRRGRRPARPR